MVDSDQGTIDGRMKVIDRIIGWTVITLIIALTLKERCSTMTEDEKESNRGSIPTLDRFLKRLSSGEAIDVARMELPRLNFWLGMQLTATLKEILHQVSTQRVMNLEIVQSVYKDAYGREFQIPEVSEKTI